jgi:hypothetical protein
MSSISSNVKLPLDLLISMGSYLNRDELTEVFGRVCKAFNKAAQADQFWIDSLKKKSIIQPISTKVKSQYLAFLRTYCSYFHKQFKENAFEYSFFHKGVYRAKIEATDKIHRLWIEKNLSGMTLFQVKAEIEALDDGRLLSYAMNQEVDKLTSIYANTLQLSKKAKQEEIISLLIDAGALCYECFYDQLHGFEEAENILPKIIRNCNKKFTLWDVEREMEQGASDAILIAMLGKMRDIQDGSILNHAVNQFWSKDVIEYLLTKVTVQPGDLENALRREYPEDTILKMLQGLEKREFTLRMEALDPIAIGPLSARLLRIRSQVPRVYSQELLGRIIDKIPHFNGHWAYLEKALQRGWAEENVRKIIEKTDVVPSHLLEYVDGYSSDLLKIMLEKLHYFVT